MMTMHCAGLCDLMMMMMRGSVVELKLLVVMLFQRDEAGEQHSPATIWVLPSWRRRRRQR
jgi:hypothetical protein